MRFHPILSRLSIFSFLFILSACLFFRFFVRNLKFIRRGGQNSKFKIQNLKFYKLSAFAPLPRRSQAKAGLLLSAFFLLILGGLAYSDEPCAGGDSAGGKTCPASFPSPLIWLKGENIEADDSDRVSVWYDNSGNNYNFVQNSPEKQPLLQERTVLSVYPSVSFSGNEFLESSSISALNKSEITCFTVFRTDNASASQHLYSSSYAGGAKKSSDDMWGADIGGGSIKVSARKANGAVKTISNKLSTDWSVHCFLWNSCDDLYSILNGDENGPARDLDARPSGHIKTVIGANFANPGNLFTGEISEIIIYNKALSEKEYNSIHTYLKNKYLCDIKGPEISSVSSYGDSTRVILSFDEAVMKADAEKKENYSIDNGIIIQNATLDADGKKVTLDLSPAILDKTLYTLTVNNIKDLKGNPIFPGTQEPFKYIDIEDEGLVLWLDAGGKTVDDETGGIISWNDMSGNSNHAIQIIKVKNRPRISENTLKDLPVMLFDGNAYLKSPSIPALNKTPVTWFIVFRSENLQDNKKIIQSAYLRGAKNASDRMWGSYVNEGFIVSHARSAKGRLRDVMVPLDSEWHILSSKWDSGKNISLSLDNAEPQIKDGANAVPDGHRHIMIGANSKVPCQRFSGEIAEMLVYSSELDDVALERVYSYLNKKYFVTAHTVKFIDGANGSITGELTQSVEDGADAGSVTAVAAAGYYFSGWTGDFTGLENPLTLKKVTSDMTLTTNFISLIADSDNDNVSDWWELKYFGGLNYGKNDDPDGDKIINYIEYKLGLNPTLKAVEDSGDALEFKLYSPSF